MRACRHPIAAHSVLGICHFGVVPTVICVVHDRGLSTGHIRIRNKEVTMNLPQVASRDECVVARKALLAKEKEARRARDALSQGFR